MTSTHNRRGLTRPIPRRVKRVASIGLVAAALALPGTGAVAATPHTAAIAPPDTVLATAGHHPVAASGIAGARSSVDILPVGTTAKDPDDGQWFVYRGAKGATLSSRAQLLNRNAVAEVVSLSARQLTFATDGTPLLSASPTAGVGSWVRFARTVLTVPAHGRVIVAFTVTVPAGADPGDNVGSLVATSAPQQVGGYNLITRTATRLYVTVPGKVVIALGFTGFGHSLSHPFWPHSGHSTVLLANIGTVRFTPRVTLNGHPMAGPNLVVSHSVERFTGTFSVPWYGGHLTQRLVATANGGHQVVLVRSFWVVPWGLVALALVTLLALLHTGFLWWRRRRRAQALRAGLLHRVAELEREASLVDASSSRQR